MPRRARIALPNVPVHLIQRGNNRQPCFFVDEDYLRYLDWLTEYANKTGCRIHAYALMTNHVHLLVNYPPKVSVSALVNSLKGVSSRMIRQKKYPSCAKKLWGNALWSPSYFAGSCGGAPIAVIRQYIEQQQTSH